ncbi:MAG: replication protein [Vampirovibrio sp.]
MTRQKNLTPTDYHLLETGTLIHQEPPERIDFLHAIMCQVGMPRKTTDERVFERHSGSAVIRLEAGTLFDGKRLVDQPLPYGTRPRLVMVHISGEAIRKQQRIIEVGNSMREFLVALGVNTSGGNNGGYTMFRKQMQALAACRLTMGIALPGRNVTVNTQPISRFEAWLNNDHLQTSLWPGVMELSHEFYETLNSHAVPLDHRALAALKHSALSLDIYTWLAHRLCRIEKFSGTKVSWNNLKEQFGQEYKESRDFKRQMRQSLHQVLAVYPDARVEETIGGLLLKPSSPPIPKSQVSVRKIIL